MKTRRLPGWIAGPTFAAVGLTTLTGLAACSLVNPPPPVLARAASVTLLDTPWRLTRLGDRMIDNPAGERAVMLTLASSSNAVTGNSGCNRMFGHYALENDMLKFDGLGGTKMFCEGRMELEQSVNNALMATISWKITDQVLELRDETNKAVATFKADLNR
ncbi:MAG TPA: META domain-containing protein [Steroidobacteraceae bacterium]|nr:META domain-containing protein [Steroidobacteraceae bacterium]